MQAQLTRPPGNHIKVPAPTTPELLERPFVRGLLKTDRTGDGLLRLGATFARLLRDHLDGYERQGLLTPEDQQLLLALRPFVDGWAKQKRAAWRALTFQEARARRTLPVRSESRRPEPRSRESQPSRRVRTASTSRGSPGSQSDPDEPGDIDGLRGFRTASSRMVAHVGRRLAVARLA
jgi:hypothetical protein